MLHVSTTGLNKDTHMPSVYKSLALDVKEFSYDQHHNN